MFSHCLWYIYIRLCSFHCFQHRLATFNVWVLPDRILTSSWHCVVACSTGLPSSGLPKSFPGWVNICAARSCPSSWANHPNRSLAWALMSCINWCLLCDSCSLCYFLLIYVVISIYHICYFVFLYYSLPSCAWFMASFFPSLGVLAYLCLLVFSCFVFVFLLLAACAWFMPFFFPSLGTVSLS